jgi:hypothetical protein
LPNLAKSPYALPIEQHHETDKNNLMGIDPLGKCYTFRDWNHGFFKNKISK